MSLKRKVAANYAGQAWQALIALAFVPIYVRLLGMDGFGLVGLMLSLQALTQLFDLGLGGTISRELARRSSNAVMALESRSLVVSFERIIWPMAALIGMVVWLASPFIAREWLHPTQLSDQQTIHAIGIMGLALACMWPTSFYTSALAGLERQGTLNAINAAAATVRAAGVVPLMYYVSSTIETFLWWYVGVGVLQSLTARAFLWRALPITSEPPRFQWSHLASSSRFAGGLMVIAALAVGTTQLDRLAISALRPLSELGIYGVAVALSGGLGRMVQPMFSALYPRFSRLVIVGERSQLDELYRTSTQLVAAIIGAAAAVLVVFSRPVVFLWTGDATLADEAAVPLAMLCAGTAMNGLMNIPYALQLANGWTRLTVWSNAVALGIGTPLMLWATMHYGINGAPLLWLAANTGYVLISAPLAHQRLLPGYARIWYTRDIGPPIAAAFAMALSARCILGQTERTLSGFASIFAVACACLLTAGVTAPAGRLLLKKFHARLLPGS